MILLYRYVGIFFSLLSKHWRRNRKSAMHFTLNFVKGWEWWMVVAWRGEVQIFLYWIFVVACSALPSVTRACPERGNNLVQESGLQTAKMRTTSFLKTFKWKVELIPEKCNIQRREIINNGDNFMQWTTECWILIMF